MDDVFRGRHRVVLRPPRRHMCSLILCTIPVIFVVTVLCMIKVIADYYDKYCVQSNTDSERMNRNDSIGVKICPPGYNGKLRKTVREINECDSTPCQNGGSCSNYLNNFTCTCLSGTSGVRCEINLDECASQPCQHQSHCIDMINGYECQCVGGYTGPTCSHEMNECGSGPCKNGATCIDCVNGYTCICPQAFTGLQCELDIDECASGPCENGGTCMNLVGGYTCDCRLWYKGSRCEVPVRIVECGSSTCKNYGAFSDLVSGYTCKCSLGQEGFTTKNKIVVADSNPQNIYKTFSLPSSVENTQRMLFSPSFDLT